MMCHTELREVLVTQENKLLDYKRSHEMLLKVGDRVVCKDNTFLETILIIDEEYIVDAVYDADHLGLKGFYGLLHSDRFDKIDAEVL